MTNVRILKATCTAVDLRRFTVELRDRKLGTLLSLLPGGITTQVRLTLLDAWSDANETSHGCSSHLEKVLAARSSVSQLFL
jgi:hypothetical protein